MAAFPLLSTQAVTQYPSARSVEFSTGVFRFVDGSEQRFRQMRQPVRRWVLRMGELSADEMQAMEAFFESRQGRMSSFEFTDPWDGTVYPDCSFEQDQFTARWNDEGRAAALLTIRNNQV